MLAAILYDHQLLLLLMRSLERINGSFKKIARIHRRQWKRFGFKFLNKFFKMPKKAEASELFFHHHVWDKSNVLLRHSKDFPLLLYDSNSIPASIHSCSSGPRKPEKNRKAKITEDNQVEPERMEPCFTSCGDFCSDELREALRPPPSVTQLYAGSRQEIYVYAVARYPENHNPLLPVSLQKNLDAMAPREFLTYVLKELTLEERESLMVDERQRRKSFLVNWPHSGRFSGVKMAQAGFYCLDNHDRVQCVFCRGSIHNWDSEDSPMTEHARSFNFCRFVKGLECGNREYKSDVLTAEDLKNIRFYCQPDMKKNRDGSVSTDSTIFGISTNKADNIRYAPDVSRLRTFARWPASSPITAKRMCEAGFYFTGFEDQVRCFYCSGGLRSWQTSDDPWEEHARWFPDCNFLLQQKGEGYVKDVRDKTPASKKLTRSTEMERKKAGTQKQQQTEHKMMIEVCLRLGYQLEAIQRVITLNGRPFPKISELIDALYVAADGGDISSITSNGLTEPVVNNRTMTQAVIPEEDRQRCFLAADSDVFMPGRMDGHKSFPDSEGACIMCYRKTGQNNPANHIGLPCGHMIYCENCNKEEMQRLAAYQAYKPLCPYKHCGTLLTASFKTYYA